MDITNSIWLIYGLIVFAFLFLTLRYLMLWYYRISERVELLKENNFLLRKACEALGKQPDELVYGPPKKVKKKKD